ERLMGDDAPAEQVRGENPESVPALLRLAAVRVEDLEPDRVLIQITDQDPVRPGAVVPVAERARPGRRHRPRQLRGVHHQVVVAQGLTLREGDSVHCVAPTENVRKNATASAPAREGARPSPARPAAFTPPPQQPRRSPEDPGAPPGRTPPGRT